VVLRCLRPVVVQLIAPRRAVPRAWTLDARGNHAPSEQAGVMLKTVAHAEAVELESYLRRTTGLNIVSRHTVAESLGNFARASG
jgi:hypothetical protein